MFSNLPTEIKKNIVQQMNGAALKAFKSTCRESYTLCKNTSIWNKLPKDIQKEVTQYLDLHDLKPFKLASKKFYFLSKHNTLWKEKVRQSFFTIYTDSGKSEVDFEKSYYAYYQATLKPQDIVDLINKKTKNIEHYISIHHLFAYSYGDYDGIDIVDAARKINNQNLLNHCYRLILDHYKNKLGEQYCTKSLERQFCNQSRGVGVAYGYINILHWAVLLRQSIETIDELIRSGADMNLPDALHQTPFFLAVHYGDFDVVQLFLFYISSDINHYDNQWVHVLSEAIRQDNLEVVLSLLEKKQLDVNFEDKIGYTPLHVAIEKGNQEIINALLKRADLYVSPYPYDNISTPLVMALKKENFDTVKSLLSFGAIIDEEFQKVYESKLSKALMDNKFQATFLLTLTNPPEFQQKINELYVFKDNAKNKYLKSKTRDVLIELQKALDLYNKSHKSIANYYKLKRLFEVEIDEKFTPSVLHYGFFAHKNNQSSMEEVARNLNIYHLPR